MQKQYKTRNVLWSVCSVVIFAGLGFLPFPSDDFYIWSVFRAGATSEVEDPGALFAFLVFYGVVYALIAAVLGWVLQAIYSLVRG